MKLFKLWNTMTKIIIITDTHVGVRSDNINILDHQKAFYDDIFFPYIKQSGVSTVYHLGDLVDRRKYINFNTLNRLHEDFLNPLVNDLKVNLHVIAGNHDVFYKDNNDLNALTELLKGYERIKFYIDPVEVTEGKSKILLLPWICRKNYNDSLELIQSTKAKLCFGHLQLIGFEMHKGSFAEDGMNKEVFSKFNSVLSGHFHHKSDYDNIHYLGCPYQMNWGDYGDTKGFHVFDLETHDLTFIPNPYSLFHKLEYNDLNTTLEEILALDFSKYKKSYIRVVVKNKTNPFWFDTFIEKLEAQEPLSIQTIEDMGNLAFDGEESDLIHVEDTITLLSNYCNQIGVSENLKPKLNEVLQSLYNEANNTRM